MVEKPKISFEKASFIRQEYQFEMIHPDGGNFCPNIGRISWIKAKGHLLEEARTAAKKTCKRCKTAYILKSN